ncbi:hypothetical protein BDQ17DRAFT_1347115 [Cyathus striatus]|nr:hypothetical protein BDQ17DRAFT_1347115 [Cyathus striatus]
MSKSRTSSSNCTGEDPAASSSMASASSSAASSSLREGTGKKTCDNCKKNKSGGALPPSNKCLNCSVHYSNKRRRPKGYIEELQDRIKELEAALRKVCPDEKLLQDIYARLKEESQNKPTSGYTSPLPGPSRRIDPAELVRKDDASETALMLRLQRVHDAGGRFYGDAGTGSFIRSAMESKVKVTGANVGQQMVAARRDTFGIGNLREQWELEIAEVASARYNFPPRDLMDELVDAYFEHVNLVLPLLHRPTFKRSIEEGLYLRDDGFGGVVLLVLLTTLFSMISVSDLCSLQLACQFLQGTSAPHSCWTIAGLGIRLAQDMGIHQRRVPLDKLTIEHELCKRAFWVLISLDRMSSIGLGRSCAIANNDMDLDMPVECDDEYWEVEDPKKRLNKIMAFALHSIYHVKSKMWEFILEDWQKHVVEEMDSALNRWLAATPECRTSLGPQRKDEKFYKLSLMLMGLYYYVQILIHRPFILWQDNAAHPFPSLTICTNAARACSNLVDAYRKRGYPLHLNLTLFAFTSGVVLALNRWGTHEIYKCLDFLKVAEERWYACGKAWDTMYGLLSSASTASTPSDAHAGIAAPRPRRTDRLRKTANLGSPSDPDSHRLLPQSYHVGSSSASTPGSSSVGSVPSPYTAPLRPTQTPGTHTYPTPPETTGTLDHGGVSVYPDLSSSVSFDPNEQLPFSNANSGFNTNEAQDPLVGMDSNTMNMWMNAPTGIGFDDWVNFFGGVNWEERSNSSGSRLD